MRTESRQLSADRASLFPSLAGDDLDSFCSVLHRLSRRPPQVLLFDGGTETQRRDMARYWSCCTLCESGHDGIPCCMCSVCTRVAGDMHFDIMAYDGHVGQKEDEENPGFFRAFTAENARGVKARLLDSPNGPYHIVFFTGIAESRPEAPNALLKILEEPSPTSLFVLLVPQREQILPTLVSRSLCLTLPWPDPFAREEDEMRELTDRLAAFMSDQGAFLGTIGAASFLNQQKARAFFVACQKSLLRALAGRATDKLDSVFGGLTPRAQDIVGSWIREADDMLQNARAPVSPVRVLSAFAMNLYGLVAARR